MQTCLLHLLDMSWEVQDLALFQQIKLPDLLLNMSQDNISVHDIAIRYPPHRMAPPSGQESSTPSLPSSAL